MYNEAKHLNISSCNWQGGLILDEISIQDDIQIVKRSDQWIIVGAVDMGPLVNCMESVE